MINIYKNRGNHGDSLVNIPSIEEGSQEPCDFSRGRFRKELIIPCAIRGRGDKNRQMLEPRKDENTNTITSVQKDNVILYLKIEVDDEQ